MCVRVNLYLIFLLAILIIPQFSTKSHACSDAQRCTFADFGLTPEEAEQEKRRLMSKYKGRVKSVSVTPVGTTPPPVTATINAAGKNSRAVGDDPNAPYSSWRFFLRQDFKDMGMFDDPKPTKNAEGADFSYALNRLDNDATWSANGMAAVTYQYYAGSVFDTVRGFALGAYGGITREIHSKSVDSNTDSRRVGVFGETGIRNRLAEKVIDALGLSEDIDGISDYFRANLALKRDHIKDSTVAHASATWQPLYFWYASRMNFGSNILAYSWEPDVQVQYDSTTEDSKTILYSGERRSLRVGPQGYLWFKFLAPNSPLKKYFERTSASVTYHWWYENVSRKSNNWLETTLTHNLTDDGYVALKFQYKLGQNEETGARTDLFKIALSAKTCAELALNAPCKEGGK